jgi:hypothetical protein
MSKAPSSTSSSDAGRRGALVNRHFAITALALCLGAELFLRAAPSLSPLLFRALYGNSLAMFMTVHERLSDSAEDVRVLALGDSLAMTQFQPDLFAARSGLRAGDVFNAAYLGMSFPSQLDMLHAIGPARFERLEHVLYFLNPRRLSAGEVTNTDVLRIGVPPATGAWREAVRERRVGPLFDRSRLYGLSRHLVFSAWRPLLLGDAPSWDHVEMLGPNGGVRWPEPRPDGDAPRYPYPPLERISAQRLDEMRAVLRLLAEAGALVTIVPSAVHPAVDVFASDAARAGYDATLREVAAETRSRYRPELVAEFQPDDERQYCDYGHMAAAGGEAYTQHLLRRGAAWLNGG